MRGDGARELLAAALPVAVRVAIDGHRGRPAAEVVARAHACARVLAAQGDALLFASPPGLTASVFAALVEALAALALAPGGVTFAGTHYEAVHPEALADVGGGGRG
jgi:hypothetical protein